MKIQGKMLHGNPIIIVIVIIIIIIIVIVIVTNFIKVSCLIAQAQCLTNWGD